MEILREIGALPFTKSALIPLLNKYKSPKDKISALLKSGDIINLKNGLYLVSEKYRTERVSLELLANQIYGPSYVSLDNALSFYGIIPERVNTISSICVKRTRLFENSIGKFQYHYAKPEYYKIGIVNHITESNKIVLIASLEKALCDKIVFSRNLKLLSLNAMNMFLEEDLRADFSNVEKINYQIIEQCIKCGIKQRELEVLINYLKKTI